MRFIQCSILYGYITDVHEKRTPFISLGVKRNNGIRITDFFFLLE